METCLARPAAARRGWRLDPRCGVVASYPIVYRGVIVMVCRIHATTYRRAVDPIELAEQSWGWPGGLVLEEPVSDQHATISRPARLEVITRAHGRCEQCGERVDALEVRQIVPPSRGGVAIAANLVALCASCHSAPRSDGWAGLERQLT
jgi:hypothetical protein